ncbi:bifunctional 2-polyprenyl-6-hydroxyphenol methylase/3-demethylubiquinol 3-O-methyltransferase UbiG [Govanella unica]|uniref:Ubiquinone biosynthesis O-methyltransferase n=1 Tax=Govanella unica TaxID=2975056 RepID=A0A9X3TVU1_9PROT|nr:bifunctional 2-polyprenyl-6-hydroxyphenol methylase/3-demethylubiquinol 3-O-methyltransferase UbiG [Govania unica]MDA5192352.1 bifunctional 2-polyprenyl-6-hydroxyphenol methylase/3-demethylubiquinol 3-O-methyltransferase UbiG [Govania unica]
MTSTTVDAAEIARFTALAAEWWDLDGPFKPLHRLNPARLGYLSDVLAGHFGRDPRQIRALSGLTLLDIGCGGGLISEPMTRLGASVTGVDAGAENIAAAETHATAAGLDIDYHATAAENLVSEGARFDIVLALEIIEHTADPAAFLHCLAALVKPGGIVIISTLNRTAKSWAMAIAAAEYILHWVPRGTHDWKKFLKPSELAHLMRNAGLTLSSQKGLVFDPRSHSWSLDDHDLDVNYFAVATPGS